MGITKTGSTFDFTEYNLSPISLASFSEELSNRIIDEDLLAGYSDTEGGTLRVENVRLNKGNVDEVIDGEYILNFDGSETDVRLTWDLVDSDGNRVTVSTRTTNVGGGSFAGNFRPVLKGNRSDVEIFSTDVDTPLKIDVREFIFENYNLSSKYSLDEMQFVPLNTGGGTIQTSGGNTLNGFIDRNGLYTPNSGYTGYDTISYYVRASSRLNSGAWKVINFNIFVGNMPQDPLVETGVEGVDFWYDGAISPNFDQDAFWYRGAAPLEEGGDSKYWFKFKNTDTTDELTGGGEYALVATKRDALDNGETLDSLTGEYVFSKSFVSPDGIRLYAGIDEAAIQELSNFGAEDIEVYRWDVDAGQIVGTDGREILGSRLDNRFDTIGEEYAGSLSELNNNAYSDTLF